MAKKHYPTEEENLYDQIREAFASKMAHDLMRDLAPMIDSLGELLGDSPEAWRGVALFATGLFTICQESQKQGEEQLTTIIKVVGLCSAALSHPKVRAVTADWPEEDDE